ncbi:MAG: hypothetical protein QXS51_02225 [Thermoproteota archaeon]|nr:hypothetical protein [Candidatus Brockarchaeota archaeon]
MRKGISKYSRFLGDEKVRRWLRNLTKGSVITGEVALRRLGKICELLETDPKGLLEWARSDLTGFQDRLEDLVASLEDEGKSPGYIHGFLKAVKSWLRYNNITLTMA